MDIAEVKETQYIRDTAIKVLMGVSFITIVLMLSAMWYKDTQAGLSGSETLYALLLVVVIEAFVFWMVFFVPFILSGSARGLTYRYRPVVWKDRLITWQEVESWKVRPVKCFSEFGGWGYRKGWKSKKTGLVMADGPALEVTYTSGKTVVFSVLQAEKWQHLARKYAPSKEVKS